MIAPLENRMALLEGTKQPETEEEKRFLAFMGGVKGPRDKWPQKWAVCDTCAMEWRATATYPSPTGRWIFPYRCPKCWEEWKAERLKKSGIRRSTIQRK